jgi:hypothetical protein
VSLPFHPFPPPQEYCTGIFKQSMGASSQVEKNKKHKKKK